MEDEIWIHWIAAFFGAVARVAVPFFFVTSGFLLARGDPAGLVPRWWRGTRRVCFWFVVYSAVYASIPCVLALWHGAHWHEALWFPRKLLASPVGALQGGASYHLWFLPQLIVGQGVVMMILRLSSSAWPVGLLAASSLLIISMQLHGLFPSGSMAGWIAGSCVHSLYAIAGVASGAWLSRCRDAPAPLVFLIAGFLLRAMELALTDNLDTPRNLSEFWAGAATFILALAAIAWARAAPDARGSNLRSISQVSVGIYLLHPIFILGLGKVSALSEASPLLAPLVFLSSYLLARVVYAFGATRPLVC